MGYLKTQCCCPLSTAGILQFSYLFEILTFIWIFYLKFYIILAILIVLCLRSHCHCSKLLVIGSLNHFCVKKVWFLLWFLMSLSWYEWYYNIVMLEKEPGMKPVWGMFTCVSVHCVVNEKFNYPLCSLIFFFFPCVALNLLISRPHKRARWCIVTAPLQLLLSGAQRLPAVAEACCFLLEYSVY